MPREEDDLRVASEWINCCRCIPFLFLLAGCFMLKVSFTHAAQDKRHEQTLGRGREEKGADKLKIRNRLRVIPTNVGGPPQYIRRPIIEFILTSDGQFPTGNEMYYLRIGKETVGRWSDGDDRGHVLVFELTPDEFAKLSDGDEVRIVYGQQEEALWTWHYGKLDKSKLDK
jgi:hypothetical protein